MYCSTPSIDQEARSTGCRLSMSNSSSASMNSCIGVIRPASTVSRMLPICITSGASSVPTTWSSLVYASSYMPCSEALTTISDWLSLKSSTISWKASPLLPRIECHNVTTVRPSSSVAASLPAQALSVRATAPIAAIPARLLRTVFIPRTSVGSGTDMVCVRRTSRRTRAQRTPPRPAFSPSARMCTVTPRTFRGTKRDLHERARVVGGSVEWRRRRQSWPQHLGTTRADRGAGHTGTRCSLDQDRRPLSSDVTDIVEPRSASDSSARLCISAENSCRTRWRWPECLARGLRPARRGNRPDRKHPGSRRSFDTDRKDTSMSDNAVSINRRQLLALTPLPLVTALPGLSASPAQAAETPSGGQVIAFITDVHVNPEDEVKTARARACAEALVELDPDLVLHGGDLTDHGTALALRTWMEMFPPSFRDRLHHVPGNHETHWNNDAYQAYEEEIGRRQYSIDLDDIHIVFTDTSIEQQGVADLDDQQISWLRRDLATAAGRPILAVGHHVLALTPNQIRNADKVLDVLTEAGAHAYLCGHIHSERNNVVNGLTELTGVSNGEEPGYYTLTRKTTERSEER